MAVASGTMGIRGWVGGGRFHAEFNAKAQRREANHAIILINGLSLGVYRAN